MPGRCDVAGCPNGPRRLNKDTESSDTNVHYHAIPRGEPLRSRWLSAFPMLQRVGKVPIRLHVCSMHFRPEDYEHNSLLRLSMDVPFQMRLRRNAVPSILPSSHEEQIPLLQDENFMANVDVLITENDATGTSIESNADCEHNSLPRQSIEVPFQARLGCNVVPSISPFPLEEQAPLLQDANVADPMNENTAGTFTESNAETLPSGAKDAETQTDFMQIPAKTSSFRSVGNAKGVQAKPLGTSVAVQVNTTVKEMKCKALQVNVQNIPTPKTSTPIKRRRTTCVRKPVKHRRRTPAKDISYVPSPDVSPVLQYPDMHDTTYEPEELTCTPEVTFDECDMDEGCTQHKDYFLVSRDNLLTLLNTCRTCLSTSCTVSLSCSGTRITAKTECPRGHEHMWASQPLLGMKPKGNVDLSAAILFSGSSVAGTLRMMRLMGVQVISDQTFFSYQKAYLFPAVTAVWDEHQKGLLAAAGDSSLELCGDGRCDSPGHSAKYLTYSFLCPGTGKIIHTEQIQVKESAQIQASSQMEKEGLIRGLQFLCDQGISIRSLTTDRHTAIKKYMRLHCPATKHQFDVWHVAKGIRRKLTAASRKARCRELLSWIQPIVNHLYWCACACGGNGDLLVATWTSLLNHIADIHDGHGNLYPRCLHGPSSRVSWLKIDSPAHKQVRAIVMAPVLLKDIRQLSPDTQTYSLESFHSVLNGYAPKSTAYTYEGMKARTLIAALHFNENANKEQATTKDGTQQWHSKTSKARHSMMTVCPLKMAATFDYVQDLQNKVTELCIEHPSFPEALAQAPEKIAPVFVPQNEPRPSKTELIAAHKARFLKF
ncbi:uncharacterized protein [Dermacentor andersoni]|uniref:uncharacterized protein isoform X2 n=1 Tax=Dermacentor andersoni TaxID=34620 RepID=UPI002415F020|nr:uncharacterized protein LOC126533291 isoform X2 [Dermacentor andersoni]